MSEDAPLLRVNALIKHFGGLVALNQVSLFLNAGEVLALLGDNGAGKSTLIKLISGVYRPDGGEILLEGEPVSFDSPLEARRRGIETIYQDLALCENLDACFNIFLGREPTRRVLGLFREVDRAYMFKEAQNILSQLDVQIPNLQQPIRYLSGGQRQAIAIARAIYWQARLVIMDEPTAALGVPEQMKVLQLIRNLKERGVPVILVTHNMRDAFAVADRAIVLRRGHKVGERKMNETDERELVELMVGAGEVTATKKAEIEVLHDNH